MDTNTAYKLVTPTGKLLWIGFTRYHAEKALMAAKESAQLLTTTHLYAKTSKPIADNFNAFPYEREGGNS